jgi:membrane-bound ClpP family serine protease
MRNANPYVRHHLYRLQLRQGLKATLLALLVLLPVAAVAFGFLFMRPASIIDDAAGAEPREGTARVTGVTYAKLPSRPNLVSLRVGGEPVRAFSFAPVRAGERVRVVYIVGQSGRLYVREIAPVEPARDGR